MPKKEIVITDFEPKDEISLMYVEAVFMPNGEVVSNGKSLGFQKDFIKIYVKKN